MLLSVITELNLENYLIILTDWKKGKQITVISKLDIKPLHIKESY